MEFSAEQQTEAEDEAQIAPTLVASVFYISNDRNDVSVCNTRLRLLRFICYIFRTEGSSHTKSIKRVRLLSLNRQMQSLCGLLWINNKFRFCNQNRNDELEVLKKQYTVVSKVCRVCSQQTPWSSCSLQSPVCIDRPVNMGETVLLLSFTAPLPLCGLATTSI